MNMLYGVTVVSKKLTHHVISFTLTPLGPCLKHVMWFKTREQACDAALVHYLWFNSRLRRGLSIIAAGGDPYK
jgi:hypothetical protein